jgi:hypothetical protein
MDRWIKEIFERYQQQLSDIGLFMAGIGLAVFFGGTLLWLVSSRRRQCHVPGASGRGKWHIGVSVLLLSGALISGLCLVISRASLVDDSFVSFRYAENLANGKGLVFNPGEYVEGFTNFLWTMIISGLYLVLPFDAPHIGLFLSMASYTGNLIVIYLVSGSLLSDHSPWCHVPIAVILSALQSTMVEFGTTGLEAGFTSLLVNLGVLFYLDRMDLKGAGLSGACFTMACFSRPDHAIFYFSAAAALAVEVLAAAFTVHEVEPTGLARLWRREMGRLFAFVAPAAAYAGLMAFRYTYYGSILPNTFFAKSVEELYWSQGIIYSLTFFLGSHFWTLLPLLVIWLLKRRGSERVVRMKIFFALSFLLTNAYIVKIGGDFMYGRFYVTLIPLIFIVVEDLVYYTLSLERHRWATYYAIVAFAFAGIASLTVAGVKIVGPAPIRWFVANEGQIYKVVSWFPLEIKHHSYYAGKLFEKTFHERGLRVPIATSGIGMVGYYSKQVVIDRLGLTDAFVAANPVYRRGRPGHEKSAPEEYFNQRGAVIARWNILPRQRHLTELRLPFGEGYPGRWFLFSYRAPLMKKIKQRSPEIGFVDFEQYLDDYISKLNQKKLDTVVSDLADFDKFYFRHNDDLRRRNLISAYIEGERARRATPNPRPDIAPSNAAVKGTTPTKPRAAALGVAPARGKKTGKGR